MSDLTDDERLAVLERLRSAYEHMGSALGKGDAAGAAGVLLGAAKDAGVREAGKRKPGRKQSEAAIRELADAIKEHQPGLPLKCTARDPKRANELAKKIAWLGERFADEPLGRKDSSYRRQAIEAAAAVISDQLTAEDELDSQTRRVRGRILAARLLRS